jgi:hypothetical protein
MSTTRCEPASLKPISGRPPPLTRRREVCRRHARGRQPLPFGRVEHPIADESRQRLLVEMLKLAPPATAEMAARRLDAVRPGLQSAVGEHHVARRGERHMAA